MKTTTVIFLFWLSFLFFRPMSVEKICIQKETTHQCCKSKDNKNNQCRDTSKNDECICCCFTYNALINQNFQLNTLIKSHTIENINAFNESFLASFHAKIFHPPKMTN